MNTEKNIWALKEQLKQSAEELRSDKDTIKKMQKGEVKGDPSTLQYKLVGKRRTHRHKHIAYSMMRGRTYEQVEPKCAEGNEPNMDLVRRIMDEYSKEDVRACA